MYYEMKQFLFILFHSTRTQPHFSEIFVTMIWLGTFASQHNIIFCWLYLHKPSTTIALSQSHSVSHFPFIFSCPRITSIPQRVSRVMIAVRGGFKPLNSIKWSQPDQVYLLMKLGKYSKWQISSIQMLFIAIDPKRV